MQKNIPYMVLAMLCLFLGAMAQTATHKTTTISDKAATSSLPLGEGKGGALKVGDRLPDVHFDNILNHSKTSAHLSNYKGKVVIIEFWATWCGGCIKGFPHLDSLQRNYNKHLQILLVNNSGRDNTEKIAAFLKRYQAGMPTFSLPVVVGNAETKQLYGRGSLPHYLWIGYDRRVKAITTANEITAQNVERFIAGLPLALPVKEAYHEQ